MTQEKWSSRQITDYAQRILKQIPSRASDRGLHVVDEPCIVMMALWSLLQWERKVGLVALEQLGVDSFDLARAVDRLLDEKKQEYPVVYDQQQQQGVLAKTGEPYQRWDFNLLVEPLLQRAEHEAQSLGHSYVGSEHVLLAIVGLADSALSTVLRQHSIDHARVRDAVVTVLQS
jgi:ATP-dependent Clp protease ATP-binding subunit ClpA